MVNVRETGGFFYITASVELDKLVHQFSFKVSDTFIHLEIIPFSANSKKVVYALKEILGEPIEEPREKFSYSDCGEETPVLFAAWKLNNAKNFVNDIVRYIKKLEGI